MEGMNPPGGAHMLPETPIIGCEPDVNEHWGRDGGGGGDWNW
jgi:hypothetical protein